MNSRCTRLALLLAASGLMLLPAMPHAFAADPAKLLVDSADAFTLLDNTLDRAKRSRFAPDRPVADDIVTASTPQKADGPDEVELAALYYYAQQKQEDRVEAETARLRVKYPGFMPPADLREEKRRGRVDEAGLWTLYDKDEFAAIEAEIAALSDTNPGWMPSEDFTRKLALRKRRAGVLQAYAAKDWAGVIEAAGNVDPLSEPEADILWMLIDAYRAAGIGEGLLGIYRGMLFRDGDARLDDDILVTTLQKATQDFSPEEIRAVVQRYATSPAMLMKLAPVTTGLLRREISDFNADETRETPLPDEQILRLRNIASVEKAPGDLSLLGWYYLKIKKAPESETWFRAAIAAEANAENAKGLYLSLAQQNKDEEAYAVAAAHLKDLSSDPLFLMNALSLRFARPELGEIDSGVVESYSTTIQKSESADHGEILAWYAYNSRQFEAALAWFEASWGWKRSPARLKGIVLSNMQLGRKSELAALRQEFEPLYPSVWEEIMRPAALPQGRRGVPVAQPAPVRQVQADNRANTPARGYQAHFKAKRYSECLADLRTVEARGRLSADAQLIKGWCQLGLGRRVEARDAFHAALGAGGAVGQDAAYGVALTLIGSKLTDDAEAFIAVHPLSAARDKEIRAEIYWQRARASFDGGQYQRVLDALNARLALIPETPDISRMRAWSHYHLGHLAEARAIFTRLNMHMGDADLQRGINAIQERMGG